MAETNDIQQDRLLDYVYGELAEADAAAFEREVQQSPELEAELETLRRTRDAARAALPEVEPPSALSNMLLHEAAKQASRARGDGGEGLWDRLLAWFQPLVAHPGLSAAAALVLFVAVVGTVGLSRVGDEAERASSEAAGAAAPAAEAVAANDEFAVEEEASPEAEAEPVLAGLDEYDLADDDREDGADDGVKALSAELGDLASSGGRGRGRREADLATDKEESNLRRSQRARAKKRAPKGKSLSGYGAERPAPQKRPGKSAPADDAVGGLGKTGPVFAEEVPETAPSSRPQAEPKRSTPPPTQQRRAPAAPPPAAVPSGMADMDAASEAEDAQSEQRRQRARQEARNEQTLARLRTVASKVKERTRRCREVARLANDLLDRDRAFYERRVAADSGVRGCAGEVRAERLRRERSRISNRSKTAEPAAEPAADEK